LASAGSEGAAVHDQRTAAAALGRRAQQQADLAGERLGGGQEDGLAEGDAQRG
jgi:hypothetical protein